MLRWKPEAYMRVLRRTVVAATDAEEPPRGHDPHLRPTVNAFDHLVDFGRNWMVGENGPVGLASRALAVHEAVNGYSLELVPARETLHIPGELVALDPML